MNFAGLDIIDKGEIFLSSFALKKTPCQGKVPRRERPDEDSRRTKRRRDVRSRKAVQAGREEEEGCWAECLSFGSWLSYSGRLRPHKGNLSSSRWLEAEEEAKDASELLRLCLRRLAWETV